MKVNKTYLIAGLVGLLLLILLIIAIIVLVFVLNNKQTKSPNQGSSVNYVTFGNIIWSKFSSKKEIKPPPINGGSMPPPVTARTGKCADPNNRYGLLFGFDGTRQDAFRLAIQRARNAGNYSNFMSLLDNGAVSYRTYAGGHFYDQTYQYTISGPGWSSVLTGVWHDEHNVTNNQVKYFNSRKVPTIFNYVKNSFPNSKTVACIDWNQLEYLTNASYLGKPVDTLFRYYAPDCPKNTTNPRCNYSNPEVHAYIQNDIQCVADIAAFLKSNQTAPKFIFLYIGALDEVAHFNAFSPNNSKYMTAISNALAQVDYLMSLINARRQKGECWLVGIANDHGGHNRTHGWPYWTDKEITSIFQDPSDPRYSGGNILSATQGHTTTTPTFLDYFGIPKSLYPMVFDYPIDTAPVRSIFVTVGVVPWPPQPLALQVNMGMPQATTSIFSGLGEGFLSRLSSTMVRADRKKLFFFSSSGSYCRFDLTTNTTDRGYPRRIWWDWPGITSQIVPMITATLSSHNLMDYYFFLNNGTYIVHRAGRANAYSISADWPGMGPLANQIIDVHAANLTTTDNNIRYQFLLSGGKFVIYNFSTKKIEGGVQRTLNGFVQGIVPFSNSIVGTLLHPREMVYYYFVQSAPFA